MQQEQIVPEEDIRVVMDEPYYTRSGAIKVMGVKSTCLSKEIREKRISVFRHPAGDLFSKDAIQAWIINRTSRARK
ncbi:MAG: hypothetical protein MJY87_02520 [Fibrobacter sp.]|nr:hypothetical protein [Fibrobacter sp.]